MNRGLPGSSVHRIFKARILEWVAISFPWDLPNLDGTRLLYLLHWQADSLPLSHLGSPGGIQICIIAGKKKKKCESLSHV